VAQAITSNPEGLERHPTRLILALGNFGGAAVFPKHQLDARRF
jgi:hypothetical protein